MPDQELLSRLARFEREVFPRFESTYRRLIAEGQHPKTLFIGCSDSRIVPYTLMDCGPGDLFISRNVGALIPPWDLSSGFHGTGAAIEFAVLQLEVSHIVVCGHSHCGAMRALYDEVPAEARHMNAWLSLARDAVLPVVPTPEALRRVEQRSVILQLERLLSYPMVARRVEEGRLFLHGWYYVIEEGRVPGARPGTRLHFGRGSRRGLKPRLDLSQTLGQGRRHSPPPLQFRWTDSSRHA